MEVEIRILVNSTGLASGWDSNNRVVIAVKDHERISLNQLSKWDSCYITELPSQGKLLHLNRTEIDVTPFQVYLKEVNFIIYETKSFLPDNVVFSCYKENKVIKQDQERILSLLYAKTDLATDQQFIFIVILPIIGGLILIIGTILLACVISKKCCKKAYLSPSSPYLNDSEAMEPKVEAVKPKSTSTKETNEEKLQELEQLLVDDDFGLAKAIGELTNVEDGDPVAKALAEVFEYHKKSIQFVKILITIEVNSTSTEGILLRGNNVTSKVLKCLFEFTSLEYVRKCLEPLITNILKDKLPSHFEVDPIKIPKDSNLKYNQSSLKELCEQFISSIIESAPSAPSEMRDLCNHIYNTVGLRFPDAKITAVGAFVFLRGFCPAIVSPHVSGISSSPPSGEVQRALTLVAKTVQNLANNIKFGKKEEYMIVMNDFIEEQLPKVQEFLIELTNTKPTKPDSTRVQITKNQKSVGLEVLYRHSIRIFPKIYKSYKSKEFCQKLILVLGDMLPPHMLEQIQSEQTLMHSLDSSPGTPVQEIRNGVILDTSNTSASIET